MTDRPDDFEDLHDPQLSKLYSRAPSAEPSRQTDAAIRRLAHEAVADKRRSWRDWFGVPQLAFAAVLLLGVGVSLRVFEQAPPERPLSEPLWDSPALEQSIPEPVTDEALPLAPQGMMRPAPVEILQEGTAPQPQADKPPQPRAKPTPEASPRMQESAMKKEARREQRQRAQQRAVHAEPQVQGKPQQTPPPAPAAAMSAPPQAQSEKAPAGLLNGLTAPAQEADQAAPSEDMGRSLFGMPALKSRVPKRLPCEPLPDPADEAAWQREIARLQELGQGAQAACLQRLMDERFNPADPLQDLAE